MQVDYIDYVTIVNEKVQSLRSKRIPFEYFEFPLEIAHENGEMTVTYTVLVGGQLFTFTGESKKIAKQTVCYAIVEKFGWHKKLPENTNGNGYYRDQKK